MPTITPVASPTPTQTVTTNTSSARDRAISALMGATPAVNQNAVSAEEMSALTSGRDDTLEASSKDTSEATHSTSSEEVKDEPLSSQYAQLAKRERAIRQKASEQDRAFKAREAALAAREAELAKSPSIDNSKYISIDDLKGNAFGILSKLGISYDDISEQAIAAQSPEAQALSRVRQEVQDEIRALREEQENTRKQIEQSQSAAYQQAIRQITNEVKDLVTSDPNFETVKQAGATKDVVELIERTFNEEGRLLTVEEATQAVEDYLVEEALKFSRIKKVQERLKPATPTKQPQGLKTLTNSMGAQKPLSARDRALLAFKGELK